MGHGGGAVLGKELDDGAADDGTIADFGNAKADGAHDIQYLKAGMLHRGAWSRMVVAQPEMSSIVSALVLLVESAARNAAFWVGLVCPLMISFMTS